MLTYVTYLRNVGENGGVHARTKHLGRVRVRARARVGVRVGVRVRVRVRVRV